MFIINFNMIYLMNLIVSSIMAINLNSLFFTWALMEFNLLMMIPLLLVKSTLIKEQSSLLLKYFLIQTVGSIMMLISLVFLNFYYLDVSLLNFIFLMALMLKSGVPPLHFWLIQLMKSMNYIQSMMILCIQKIIPLFLLSMMFSESLFIFIILGSLMGGFMGLNQNSILVLLTYSSMVHFSWMMSTVSMNILASFLYLMVYTLITMMLMMSLNSFGFMFISDFTLTKNSYEFKLIICSILLVLSGTPPFIGFFTKIIILTSLMQMNFSAITLSLIIGSLMSFFYYTRMMIISSLFNFNQLKEKISMMNSKKIKMILVSVIWLSTMTPIIFWLT